MSPIQSRSFGTRCLLRTHFIPKQRPATSAQPGDALPQALSPHRGGTGPLSFPETPPFTHIRPRFAPLPGSVKNDAGPPQPSPLLFKKPWTFCTIHERKIFKTRYLWQTGDSIPPSHTIHSWILHHHVVVSSRPWVWLLELWPPVPLPTRRKWKPWLPKKSSSPIRTTSAP